MAEAGAAARRILLLSLDYAPERSGIAVDAADLAQWFTARGASVEVVAGHRMAAGGWWRDETGDGITVARCPVRRAALPRGLTGRAQTLSFALSSAPALLRVARRFAPDLVAAFAPRPALLPATLMAARQARARSWLHLTEDQPLPNADGLAGLARHFDHVSLAAISAEEKLASLGIAEARRLALPPWVDTRAIYPLAAANPIREALRLPEDAVVALYTGALDDGHGLDLLLGAARRSPDQGAVVYVVCGHGPAWRRLAGAARHLPPFRLIPWPPAGDLNALLNLADIHVLPGGIGAADALFPGKLAALLASGRPVIAADDPRDLPPALGDAVAAVAPEPDAFAAAVIALAAAPAQLLRRGAAARRAAQDYYERQRVLRRLEQALALRPVDAATP
jgi:colanic acid biosynthesis glycosyl transferase WcaI